MAREALRSVRLEKARELVHRWARLCGVSVDVCGKHDDFSSSVLVFRFHVPDRPALFSWNFGMEDKEFLEDDWKAKLKVRWTCCLEAVWFTLTEGRKGNGQEMLLRVL